MKIIVAGNGKVGAALVRQLADEGHDLTLIDSNERVLKASIDRFDVMAVQGNCACMDVLRQAGVKNADLLIALTGEDEINLLCCLTARVLNKSCTPSPESAPRNMWSRFMICGRYSRCP